MSDTNDISDSALRGFIDAVDRVLDECDREHLPAERLSGYLADACTNLEQVMREKAELASRVVALEAALRGLSSDLDRVLAMRSTLGRTEWLTTIAENARRALEVEP